MTDLQSVVLDKLAVWQRLPARIEAATTQAYTIREAAQAQGNMAVDTAVAVILSALASLSEQVSRLGPDIATILDVVNQGQPLTPTVMLLVLQTGVAMSAALTAEDQNEIQIGSIAPKVLSVDQVAQLGIGAVPAGSISWVTWLVLAFGGAYALKRWRRR